MATSPPFAADPLIATYGSDLSLGGGDLSIGQGGALVTVVGVDVVRQRVALRCAAALAPFVSDPADEDALLAAVQAAALDDPGVSSVDSLSVTWDATGRQAQLVGQIGLAGTDVTVPLNTSVTP